MTGPESEDQFLLKVGNNRYDILEQIGTGGYGNVYLACLKSNNDLLFALKVCTRQSTIQRQTFENEVFYAHLLNDSQATVSLFDSYTFTYNKKEFGVLCYERMDIDVMDYLLAKGPLCESTVKLLFSSMCKCIAHCHLNGVSHLDIKPENFLIRYSSSTNNSQKNPEMNIDSSTLVKLCDFGFMSKFKYHSKLILDEHKGMVGTREYRAPEIQIKDKKKKKFQIFTKQISFFCDKADIYSLGVTLYVLMTGFFPYTDMERQTLEINPQSFQYLREVCENDQCLDLVQKMLNPNPLERLSIVDVISHPWLSSLQSKPIKPEIEKLDLDFTDSHEFSEKHTSPDLHSTQFTLDLSDDDDDSDSDENSGDEKSDTVEVFPSPRNFVISIPSPNSPRGISPRLNSPRVAGNTALLSPRMNGVNHSSLYQKFIILNKNKQKNSM